MDVKTVLLIDDDNAFLYLTTVFIKKLYPALTIHTAMNGEVAIQLMEKIQPDIVFLDINMPVMNGWEFLEALTANEVKVNYPIFITSSSIDPEDKKKSKHHHLIYDFIEKPLNPDKIRNIFNTQMTKR